MDFHLDRRLRLLTDPEHRSLYTWAINELDEHGKVVGRDQIPWVWHLYFTATELILGDQINVKEAGEIEGRLPQEAEISHRRTIRAKLRPGNPRRDDDWRETTYRMFGADRVITSFQVDVLQLESEDETESCQAWGSVSYTADNDFTEKTTEDCVIFYLMVKPSTFERYAQRIALGTADEVILCVGMVSGFYSDWSPAISTRDIKVLTRGSKQDVELPAGSSFEMPRLGQVGEAQLFINAIRVQAKKQSTTETESLEEEKQTMALVRPELATALPGGADPQTTNLLASLKTSARWIIGLLIVLIVATIFKG